MKSIRLRTISYYLDQTACLIDSQVRNAAIMSLKSLNHKLTERTICKVLPKDWQT